MATPSAGLASRVREGKSAIHGRGLYARKRLRKGSYIGSFEGVATRRDGTHVLWWRDEEDELHGLRVTNALRFLNHSSNPNAEIEGRELVALRNIQRGAEITIHYGEDWDDLDE